MFKILKVKTTQITIICSVYGLILILLYIFLARPISLYSARLKSEMASQSQKIKEYEDLIRTYPNPEREIENIEKKIEELKNKLVSREQIPRIIQQLARKTNELNINTISIKPREDIKPPAGKTAQAVKKVYIEIVMLSPYQVVGDYLKAITELPLILTVESLSIEKKEKTFVKSGISKTNKLLATLLLSAYMYSSDTGD